jgi:formate dehydrogenase assembly factor FdhD
MFLQLIKSIAECGANVIITSSKFSEMAMHYCERYKIMMLKARTARQTAHLAWFCRVG